MGTPRPGLPSATDGRDDRPPLTSSGSQPRRGWTRVRSKRAFVYLDQHGRPVQDADAIDRIEGLAIPPAWKDVWISPRPHAKLQATGFDKAGRKQYLYHRDFRARQEREKYDRLIRFAEKLPELRAVMAVHLNREELDHERVAAIALRMIDSGWFRVGSEQHARASGTYGITTLRKRHVTVRGHRVKLSFRGKHRIQTRSTLVDAELAAAIRELAATPGGSRLFRYVRDGRHCNLTSRQLNDYVKLHLGPEFTAKDFRTWGGTLRAAVELAEDSARNGFPQSVAAERRSVSAAMRRVATQLGNTPAVCRASYVSPSVIDHYLKGRTIENFRPRHLRLVNARQVELEPEEQGMLALLRA
jgi:DNA topoisomerase-1